MCHIRSACGIIVIGIMKTRATTGDEKINLGAVRTQLELMIAIVEVAQVTEYPDTFREILAEECYKLTSSVETIDIKGTAKAARKIGFKSVNPCSAGVE